MPFCSLDFVTSHEVVLIVGKILRLPIHVESNLPGPKLDKRKFPSKISPQRLPASDSICSFRWRILDCPLCKTFCSTIKLRTNQSDRLRFCSRCSSPFLMSKIRLAVLTPSPKSTPSQNICLYMEAFEVGEKPLGAIRPLDAGKLS